MENGQPLGPAAEASGLRVTEAQDHVDRAQRALEEGRYPDAAHHARRAMDSLGGATGEASSPDGAHGAGGLAQEARNLEALASALEGLERIASRHASVSGALQAAAGKAHDVRNRSMANAALADDALNRFDLPELARRIGHAEALRPEIEESVRTLDEVAQSLEDLNGSFTDVLEAGERAAQSLSEDKRQDIGHRMAAMREGINAMSATAANVRDVSLEAQAPIDAVSRWGPLAEMWLPLEPDLAEIRSRHEQLRQQHAQIQELFDAMVRHERREPGTPDAAPGNAIQEKAERIRSIIDEARIGHDGIRRGSEAIGHGIQKTLADLQDERVHARAKQLAERVAEQRRQSDGLLALMEEQARASRFVAQRIAEAQRTDNRSLPRETGDPAMPPKPPLPVIPPLPPRQRIPEGVVPPPPEDPSRDAVSVTGIWRQISPNRQADFLPGGYHESIIVFKADGTLEISRTYGHQGSIRQSWRFTGRWNDDRSQLTIAHDQTARLSPNALNALYRPLPGTQATDPIKTLPCILPLDHIGQDRMRLGEKDYRRHKDAPE